MDRNELEALAALRARVSVLEETVLAMSQGQDWLREQARMNQEIKAGIDELVALVKGGGADATGDALRRLLDEREEGD